MLYSLSGTVQQKKDGFLVLDVHGVGFKVAMPERALSRLPRVGTALTLFTHLYVREDLLDLYGFATEEELGFFEQLISVSGVGPKSALAVLDVAELNQLASAIQENRPDLLTKASGIGRKTAERIVVELKNKLRTKGSGATVKAMEVDADLVETLVSLGYRREESREALARVESKTTEPQERLKSALRALGRK